MVDTAAFSSVRAKGHKSPLWRAARGDAAFPARRRRAVTTYGRSLPSEHRQRSIHVAGLAVDGKRAHNFTSGVT